MRFSGQACRVPRKNRAQFIKKRRQTRQNGVASNLKPTAGRSTRFFRSAGKLTDRVNLRKVLPPISRKEIQAILNSYPKYPAPP